MSGEFIKLGIKTLFCFNLSNLFLTETLSSKADFKNINRFIKADLILG